VEHEGTVYAVQRRRREDGDDDVVEDKRERVEIGGDVFAVADETEVAVQGGRVVRCVEFPTDSEAALRLTVTEEAEEEVGKKVALVGPDGELCVLDSAGSFDTAAGTRDHVVDVQGKEGPFVLRVSVREEEARIVRVERLN
jgi:hypothetical protein